MGKKELQILIIGEAGRGKSTMARIIQHALQDREFDDVTIKDEIVEGVPDSFNEDVSMNLRCEAIKDLSVLIKTKQSVKGGFNV